MRHFTNDVQFPLKGHFISKGWTASDENLTHEGLAGLSRLTQGSVIRRNIAPAENGAAFASGDFFKNGLGLGAGGLIG